MTPTRWLAGALAVLAATPVLAQAPPEALAALLRLQPDQHPAWRAYKDSLAQTRAAQSHDAAEVAQMNSFTTPERLDALRAQLKAQADDFERQARATQAFYAVLSPEQRSAFDALTRAPAPPSPMHVGRQGDPSPPAGHALRVPPTTGLPPPAP